MPDNTTDPSLPQEAETEEAAIVETGELNGGENTSIAELLATLSQPAEFPEGTGQKNEHHKTFEATEVDFKSGDWLQKLTLVQSWLCLDAPIDKKAKPEVALQRAFQQVSPGKPLSELVKLEPYPALTELGAQRLESYLNRAVDLRVAFQEATDEGQSKNQASANWRADWEEWGAQAKRQPGRIIAEVSTWKIKGFGGLVEDENDIRLDLNPSFQRGDVWSIGESQLLIESILLGIPLPSVILTKDNETGVLQIVDGKQRLTAILRFIGRHPVAKKFAAKKKGGVDLFNTNFKKFVRQNQIKNADLMEHYLPFRLPGYLPGHPLHEVSKKYYCEIKSEVLEIGGEKVKIKNLFEAEDTTYQIPVILYKNTKIQDIHRVFGLYNKQGRKLNAEELRNAIYHHLHLPKLLLYLSGDRSSEASRDKLAKYLPQSLAERAKFVGSALEEKGFGTARFRRFKVLSWATAILAHPPNKMDAGYATPSTASHIDSLLEKIDEDADAHSLYKTDNLIALTETLCDALELQSAMQGAWHPNFKSKDKLDTKWEELPFVASLIASFMLVLAKHREPPDAFVEKVRKLTERRVGPKKSQNKTQWGFIASVVHGVLAVDNTDTAALAAALKKLFGESCLPAIASLAVEYNTSEFSEASS